MSRIRKPHHTAGGFKNTHEIPSDARRAPPQSDDDADDFEGLTQNLLEPVEPDARYLRRNREESTITWLGHSTFLLQLNGVNILTDPHLGPRASALPLLGPQRAFEPPMDHYDLPPIHAVVISHDHYDHLDRRTVRRLIKQKGGQPHFYVPLGLKPRIQGTAYSMCTELDWWEWAQAGGVNLHCVPAHHGSGRLPWRRNTTLWCGWVIEHIDFRFYFAGDTAYSPVLQDIGRRFPAIDLAALPIAGHGEIWPNTDELLSPEWAVRAHQDIRARHTVGMHWGTFAYGRKSLDEAPRRLARAAARAGLPEEAVFVMRQGETLALRALGERRARRGAQPGYVTPRAMRPVPERA